jgi:hypothetical protein
VLSSIPVLKTENVVFTQGRPPEPVDEETSITKSSSFPKVDGTEPCTTGYRTRKGAEIENVTERAKFRLLSDLTASGSNVIKLPGTRVEKLFNVIDKIEDSDQKQFETEDPLKLKIELHGNIGMK